MEQLILIITIFTSAFSLLAHSAELPKKSFKSTYPQKNKLAPLLSNKNKHVPQLPTGSKSKLQKSIKTFSATDSRIKPVIKAPKISRNKIKPVLKTPAITPKLIKPIIKPSFKKSRLPTRKIQPSFKKGINLKNNLTPQIGQTGFTRPKTGNTPKALKRSKTGSQSNARQGGFMPSGREGQGFVPSIRGSDSTNQGTTAMPSRSNGVPVVEFKGKPERVQNPFIGGSSTSSSGTGVPVVEFKGKSERVQNPFVGGQTTRSGGLHREAKESFSSEGAATFTLGNNQQVPRTDGQGGVGIVDDKGGVLYPDGTYINVGDDGGTNVFNPDGSRDEEHSRAGIGAGSAAGENPFVGGSSTRSGSLHREAKESFSSEGAATFTLGNNQQVPRTDGQGGVGIADDKGGVLYPDGTYINVGDDGGTNVFNPDGSRDEEHSRPGSSQQDGSRDNRDSSNSTSSNDSDNNSSNNSSDEEDSDNSNSESESDSESDSESESESDSDGSAGTKTETEGDKTKNEDTEASQTENDAGSYGGYTSESKQNVDSASQVGNSTVEETNPGECGDGKGGQVMDQQNADNCMQGGFKQDGSSDSDNRSPGSSSIWQAPSQSMEGSVVQPGIADEQFNEEGLSTMENVERQIDSVTNPGDN